MSSLQGSDHSQVGETVGPISFCSSDLFPCNVTCELGRDGHGLANGISFPSTEPKKNSSAVGVPSIVGSQSRTSLSTVLGTVASDCIEPFPKVGMKPKSSQGF